MATAKLSDQQITAGLATHPGWRREGDFIAREFKFSTFPDAIAFTTRLAFAAEANDHHPDLTISYRRVTVKWSTHDAGGITDKDLAGAAETDKIASAFPSDAKR